MAYDRPALGELADADDSLDGCDIDFAPYAVNDLEQLEVVLLGQTQPGTMEALRKLSYYRALADAASD